MLSGKYKKSLPAVLFLLAMLISLGFAQRSTSDLPICDLFEIAAFSEAALEKAAAIPADRTEIAGRYFGFEPIDHIPPMPKDWKDGDLSGFFVINPAEKNTAEINAEVVFVGTHSVYWVDLTESFDLTDAVRSEFTAFDQEIYPMMVQTLGSEENPGIDNDTKVHVVFTRAIGSGLLGYYSSRDAELKTVMPYSNECEMFFLNASMLSADPRQISNTLTHEFQHMIHSAHDSNETSFIDEGLSGLAELLAGNRISDTYESSYLAEPDISLINWPTQGSGISSYGGAFLFMKYFYDKAGADGIKTLVREQANGLAGLDAVLKRISAENVPTNANELFTEYMLSLLAANEQVNLTGSGFRHDSLPFSSADHFAETLDCHDGKIQASAWQYGIDAYQLKCPEGKYRIRLSASPVTGLVSEAPDQGIFAWWSIGENNSVTFLERDLDLREMKGQIHLGFSLWRDLEADFDYLYLLASADGGEHWQNLTADGCTTTNESGFNLGCGYTGKSDGSEKVQVDLSAYQGKTVTLRFEMITDQAVLGEGVWIDDIYLASEGNADLMFSSQQGWRAQGFARVSNTVRQRYSVVSLNGNRESPFRIMELAEPPLSQTILCDFNDSMESICSFAVSPINRYSRKKADYLIEITRLDD